MKKRAYLYEIPVFYFFLFCIEKIFFPDRPAFYQFDPHPYWLGILLFGLRYGVVAGFTSGLASAALYLGQLFFVLDRYLLEDPEFYFLPGLFFLAALGLGAWSDRFLKLIESKDKQIHQLEEQRRQLDRQLGTQQQAIQNLEKKIVSQMASLAVLYQGARKLNDVNREKLLVGICDFFSQALSANKAALYLRKNNQWVMHHSQGWDEQDAFPTAIHFMEGLIGKAGAENRMVSLQDWFGNGAEDAWKNKNRADAILAGPICNAEREVVAVYAVQDMPFLQFNSASLNLLSLLINWAETSIARSFYVDELKSKSIMDEVYGLYNEQYFASRMTQEFTRSKIYSLPFSILCIRFKNLELLPPDAQVRTLSALSRFLYKLARPIDIVTKLSDLHLPFAILMITTSKNQAEEFKAKILQAYQELKLEQLSTKPMEMQIGIGSFHPQQKQYEDLLNEAKNQIQ